MAAVAAGFPVGPNAVGTIGVRILGGSELPGRQRRRILALAPIVGCAI